LLVVNADSWASMTVANEYVHLRQVPACNVLYLSLADLPSFEGITIDVFRDRILKPTLGAIAARGLGGQIDCIVYSSDIPYNVDFTSDVGKTKLSRVITSPGSINGLTFLYRQVLAKDINYLQLNSNRY
jgi:hypothetical protein